METTEKFSGWCVVEVMGHKRYAGFVSEQTIAGSALVRVDVPATEPSEGDMHPATAPYTKLVGVQSIYCITPTTEELARRAARQLERFNDPMPVVLPSTRALPAPASPADEEGEWESEDDDLPY